MKNTLQTLLISALVLLFGVNIPASYLNVGGWLGNDNLGLANLTDITSGTTISSYPSIQNSNNTALENAINTIEGTTTNSTITTLSGLTTASSLASIGTITTGTWNGTVVDEVYGGTGQSTLTTGDIIYASGANTFAKLGIGSASQLLQVSGGVPTWATVTTDESTDYTWTGYHTFGNFEWTTASGTDLTIDNDLTVTGGIGTTTAGVIQSTGDLYVGGGGIMNLNFGTYTNTGALPTTDEGLVNVTATCGVGSVIGGGFSGLPTSGSVQEFQIIRNYPSATTTWNTYVECQATTCTSGTLTVHAICLDI